MIPTLVPLLSLYLINYLVGAIPFSFIIGKLYGKDIRRVGSLNVGASNVLRVCGKTAGALAYIADIGKGILTAIFSLWWLNNWGLNWHRIGTSEINAHSLALLTAFFIPVLGHIFPIYLKFKGGKGVATSAGIVLVILPLPTLGALLIFALTFLFSKTVSLGSMAACLSFPWILWAQYHYQSTLGILGWQTSLQKTYPVLLVSLTSFLAMFIVVKHANNIHRLFQRTEERFQKRKTKKR